MPMASTPDCEVEASGGLAGLESQGRGRAPHPIVGGAICPSGQARFGRCSVVPSSPPRGVVLSEQRRAGMASTSR
jgi:hypothetical protein